jgi:hypothetical protein
VSHPGGGTALRVAVPRPRPSRAGAHQRARDYPSVSGSGPCSGKDRPPQAGGGPGGAVHDGVWPSPHRAAPGMGCRWRKAQRRSASAAGWAGCAPITKNAWRPATRPVSALAFPLGLSARSQRRRPPERQVQRLPSRDTPDTPPGVLIIRDPREQPAKLNRRGELAGTIECSADHSRLFLRYNEHRPSMGS